MKNRISMILFAVIMVLTIVPFLVFTVFADTPEAEVTEVATFGELINAVNSDKTHIKLTKDIKDIVPDDELPTKHRLVFDGGKDYTLDLCGNELMVGNYANEFYTDNFSMIAVSNNSNLEIKNGVLLFENWYTDHRTAKGVVFVSDNSTLTATEVDMYNGYTGTVVYATDNANVTIDGGDYTVMSGFAVYLEKQAALTLDGGVWIGTKMGDSTATVYLDGYGALYSESTGKLTINNAYFNTGIQVHESQVGAFSAATHELVINGIKQAEDVYFSGAGNQFSAIEAGKNYYWYKNGYSRALYKIENPLFANAVSVISYEKEYSIDIKNGTATVGGNTVTKVGYGQTVTIVADPAESGMEFVRWDTSGVELADYYSTTTTFTMPAAPVYIAAYYGKESVKSVSVTVGDITAGTKAYDTEITLDGGVKLEKVEWYENLIKMEDNDFFKPGKAYELKILVYPPDEHKFGDTVTATVNGKQATVNSDSGYAIISYTFDALAENPFSVIYNTSTAKLGIGGLLELDTALMCSQNAEFNTAFEAGNVVYQWYKNGEAIEGATNALYNFTADDVGCRFFVTVTVGDKTAWGDTHPCYNHLYQIYLSASDFVAGGKAPQISSATPGVSIDPESLVVCEGYGQPELDIQNAILIPGKTYLVIGTLVQTGEANIPYEANVYVNDALMDDKVDAIRRFFYKFTVPEADYPVYYTANGEIGIGVTLTVDTEKMCNESSTFKNAYDKANPTYQTVFYQWYKNGEAIKDATAPSYTVSTTDRDSYINCKVTLVDGKYGIGEQHIITNVITVINVTMPIPKDGETRITSEIYADGVNLAGIMWWPQETGATMQGDDKYGEGTVYEYLISFEAKDTFALDFTGEMTVAYVNGVKIAGAGSGSGAARYTGEVTAIHKHQYNDEVWAFDKEGHWQACIVPGCPNPNEDYVGYVFHWGGNATCHTAGTCGQCGAEYYAEHDIAIPNYVYIDDMKCGSFCATEGCDYLAQWSYHTGGTSDCQNKAICEICHSEYGKLGEHVAKAEWVSDGTYHWHECKNCDGQQLDKVACSGGTATCTEKAVCAICNTAYGNTAPHNYTTVNGYKGIDGHASTCSCGAHDTPIAHTPDRQSPTENDPVKCTVCEYIITPATGHINHTPKAEWTTDADNHWHECIGCEGQQLEKAAHTDSTGDGKCDTCEYQMTNGGGNTETPDNPNNTPDNPDNTPDNPNNTPEDPNKDKGKLGAGAIVGIVIGSALAVGIGGFSLIWFVIKKNSLADLIGIFKK